MKAEALSKENLSRSENQASKYVQTSSEVLSDEFSDLGKYLLKVKDQVTAVVSKEAVMVANYTEKAINQILEAVEYVEKGIRKHPFIAAGVALSAGVIVMNLMMRNKLSARAS